MLLGVNFIYLMVSFCYSTNANIDRKDNNPTENNSR